MCIKMTESHQIFRHTWMCHNSLGRQRTNGSQEKREIEQEREVKRRRGQREKEGEEEAHQKCTVKGKKIPGPSLSLALHSAENRSPLSRFNVGSHVFVHSFEWTTVEPANVKRFFNAQVVFQRVFAFSVGSAKDFGSIFGDSLSF